MTSLLRVVALHNLISVHLQILRQLRLHCVCFAFIMHIKGPVSHSKLYSAERVLVMSSKGQGHDRHHNHKSSKPGLRTRKH